MDDLYGLDVDMEDYLDPGFLDLDEDSDFAGDTWDDDDEEDGGYDGDGEGYGESDAERRLRRRGRGRAYYRARSLNRMRRGRRYGRRYGMSRRSRWARRRGYPSSRGGPRPAPAAPVKHAIRQTQREIGKVDLENKVQSDILASRLSAQAKRLDRAEYTHAATKIVDEVERRFPDLYKNNKALETIVPLLPLLALSPRKKGSGLDGFLRDPRVLGIGAATALAAFKGSQSQDPQRVQIQPATGVVIPAQPNQTFQFVATVFDSAGKTVSGRTIRWASLNHQIAQINADTGMLTVAAAGNAGPVTITATDSQNASLTSAVTVNVA